MYITVGYMTSLGLFIFTRWIYNTLEFRRKLNDSAPLLGVLLLIFDVRSFLEEAPKLSEKFLLMLPTFSKRKLWKVGENFDCFCTIWRRLYLAISLGVSAIVARLSDHLTTRLEAFFWDLDCPKVYRFYQGVFSLPPVLLLLWRRRYR